MIKLVQRKLCVDSIDRVVFDTSNRTDVVNATYNFTTVVPDTMKYYKSIRLLSAEIPMTGYNVTLDKENTNSVIEIYAMQYEKESDGNGGYVPPAVPVLLSTQTNVYSITQGMYSMSDIVDAYNNALGVNGYYSISANAVNIFDGNEGYNTATFTITNNRYSYKDDTTINVYYELYIITDAVYDGLTVFETIGYNQGRTDEVDGVIVSNPFMINNNMIDEIKNGTKNELVTYKTYNLSGNGLLSSATIIQIPEGEYTTDTLAVAVTDAIRTYSGVNDFIMEYSSVTGYYKYTVDTSNDPVLLSFGIHILPASFDDGDADFYKTSYAATDLSILPMLGIDSVSPPVPENFIIPKLGDDPIQSDMIASLSRDEYLYIGVNVVRGQSSKLIANLSNLYDKGIVARVQVTQVSGKIQFVGASRDTFSLVNQLSGDAGDEHIQSDLIITLYRADGSMYNLNGADWSLTLELGI